MIQLRMTTSEPKSMAMLGNPLVAPKNMTKLMESKTKGDRAYLHGEIENKAGYDIPLFLDGDLGQLDLPTEEQDILVLLPSGEFSCTAELMTTEDVNAYYITLKQ